MVGGRRPPHHPAVAQRLLVGSGARRGRRVVGVRLPHAGPCRHRGGRRAGLRVRAFVLDAGTDGATCAPTTEPAGITISAEALGAAYLGGVSLRTLAAAGQVDTHATAPLATADAMFRGPVAPWCTTWF